MNDTALFGEQLRRRRKALDLTKQQLADRVGCAVSTIVKFEHDLRRPSREMAGRLAEILELPPDQRRDFLSAARRCHRNCAGHGWGRASAGRRLGDRPGHTDIG